MKSIFISYRRSDSADATGRIAERIAKRVGSQSVFKDVDSIDPGENFDEKIRLRLGDARVVVAVIGESWLDARDDAGHRRLDDPADYVRRELAQALADRRIRVIPVLIGEARLPQAAELPPDLQPLCFRQCVRIRRDPYFHTDIQRLMRQLPRTGARRPALIAAAFLFVVAAAFAVAELRKSRPINLAQGAKDTVTVVCVFSQTGETSKVILPLDMNPASAAKLLQERVYGDPHAAKKLQWAQLLTPSILMNEQPLKGNSLRESGVKDGCKLKLAIRLPANEDAFQPFVAKRLDPDRDLIPAAASPAPAPPIPASHEIPPPAPSPASPAEAR